MLAAGDEEETIYINCHIYGRDEFVSLAYSSAEKSLWIDIFTADESDFAVTFEQAEIIDANGNVLGIIQNGQCKIDGLKNFDGSIGIRSTDDIVYSFIQEE